MDDKAITRTLASNNAVHGTHADQGRYKQRIKRRLSGEATEWTKKESGTDYRQRKENFLEDVQPGSGKQSASVGTGSSFSGK